MANFPGSPDPDNLPGVGDDNSGNDSLTGLGGNDTLDGGLGNDTLDGGVGLDSMTGGDGNDLYKVDLTTDIVVEGDGLDSGEDTVESTASSYTLANNVENLSLMGAFTALQKGLTGNGNALNNRIIGTGGKDTLEGRDGNDTLDGGTGIDVLRGGLHDDTYYVDQSMDSAVELPGGGVDEVISTAATYTLGVNVENLTLKEGAGDLSGNGNALVNIITGNSGNNRLNGGLAADELHGGDGDDTYVIDATDTIFEDANHGNDTVEAGFTYDLTARPDLENITLTGAAVIDATGNDEDNKLIGNSAKNRLTGKGGNDTLEGNAGDDTLDGDTGADLMKGGAGNDSYKVNNAGDVVDERTPGGADAGGTDSVESKLTTDYVMPDFVENITLHTDAGNGGAIGNSKANLMTGNNGNNRLDGGTGNDTMIGRDGNDTYVVDSVGDKATENLAIPNATQTSVTLLAGTDMGGFDVVESSLASYTLPEFIEVLRLTGNALNGYGNGSQNIIEGNSLANFLQGGNNTDATNTDAAKNDDVLLGGGGNDTLKGDAGSDTMTGGEGNDYFYVDNAGDVVNEASGEGNDTIDSTLDVISPLADHVENLRLNNVAANGSRPMSATGNSLDNRIYGNDLSNLIDATQGGNDTLEGGNANDVYFVDSFSDRIVETSAGGTSDSVYASSDFQLDAFVEHLTLQDGGNFSGIGNDQVNIITGNSGNNDLKGFTGNDTLNGGAGNDTLDGGIGIDRMVGGTGDDKYYVDGSNLNTSTTANVLKILASNATAYSNPIEIANEFDFIELTSDPGNNANDLEAALNDLLNAMNAFGQAMLLMVNMILTEGAMNAVFFNSFFSYVVNPLEAVVEDAAAGVDTLVVSANYVAPANIEKLHLAANMGLKGFLLSGNTLDNEIIGGLGNDTLAGQKGQDTLIGGAGDDTYYTVEGYQGDAGDIVLESVGGGNDTVITSGDFIMQAGAEIETVAASAFFEGDEVLLVGNAFNNKLVGNVGHDTLIGGDGDDILNAGKSRYASHHDLLIGGKGNDTYIVTNSDNIVREHDTDYGDDGHDLVMTTDSYSLAGTTVEDITALEGKDVFGRPITVTIDLTGNDLDNVLTGHSGINNMTGGNGNDVYLINSGDNVFEFNGRAGGVDTVIANLSMDLSGAGSVENAMLTGTASLNLTGNATENVLVGNDGSNIINGLGGADTMYGGNGLDTYIVDDLGDQVLELASEGFDLVKSSVSFTLGNYVEDLTLTGTNAIDGTGNSFGNKIIGNSAHNVLNGMGGADTMDGGGGQDFYYVDHLKDMVIDNVIGDHDWVISTIDTGLGANFEHLQLEGNAIAGAGNIQANIIKGNNENNMLAGLFGNDTLEGGGGNDTMVGGDGNDSLVGGSGNDDLEGGGGTDTMKGGTGDDTYIVDVTNMDINGNQVGTGDQAIERDPDGDGGYDGVITSVNYSIANWWIEEITAIGTANINLTGNNLDNIIIGNTGNNRLRGLGGDDIYYATAGDFIDETTDGTTDAGGFDTVAAGFNVDLGGAPTLEGVYLMGTTNLLAKGNTANNLFLGNSGANILDGRAGADTMSGRAGNDTYYVDNFSDVVDEWNADQNADAGGTDTVFVDIQFANSGGGNATYNMTDFVENAFFTANSFTNSIFGNAQNNLISANSNDNTIWAGAGNDTVLGNAGEDEIHGEAGNDSLDGGTEDDELYGDAGNDNLFGQAGNDELDGGTGNDTMSGGVGDDIYYVDSTLDKVTETSNYGVADPWAGQIPFITGFFGDTVVSTVSHTLGAFVENLTLDGFAYEGRGNSLSNFMIGNQYSNFMWGGAGGLDTLWGGAGDDTYMIDFDDTLDPGSMFLSNHQRTTGYNDLDADDQEAVDLVDEGRDTVQITGTFDISQQSWLENITLLGMGSYNATGNDKNNILIGNAGANLLVGGKGNDRLEGGKGKDTLRGGAGSDTYVVTDATDVVEETAVNGLSDIDELIVTFSHTLSNDVHIENLTLNGGAMFGNGNGLNNVITGNMFNNTLDGGLGADTLKGGAGNDTYYYSSPGDRVFERFNEGIDTIISGQNLDLGNTDGNAGSTEFDHVENLTFSNTGFNQTVDFIGTGNGLNNKIVGNDGDNSLLGMAGNDTLEGGLGNDTLNGGTGTDSLVGGAGDDTYYLDNFADKVTDTAGTADKIVLQLESLAPGQFSATYTLMDSIENLSLHRGTSDYYLGFAGITLKGNKSNNQITGSFFGVDILDGGLGADTLTGNGGNDIYYYDALDTIVEGTQTNDVDILVLNQSADLNNLPTNVTGVFEGLTLLHTGMGHYNLTGSDSNNALAGNKGNNIITGGLGHDTLFGGLGGNDSLNGGMGDDSYFFVGPSSAFGKDTIEDAGGNDWAYFNSDNSTAFLGYHLPDPGRNIDLNQDVYSLGANSVTGMLSIENVHGGNGNDTITGSTGDNRLAGHYGNDKYVFLANGGNDTVFDAFGTDNIDLSVYNKADAEFIALDNDGWEGAESLLIKLDDNNSVLVSDYFAYNSGEGHLAAGYGFIESIRFANNVTVDFFSDMTLSFDTPGQLLIGEDDEFGFDWLEGGSGDDTIIGMAGGDILQGYEGNDSIDGGDGQDDLDGGEGDDTMIGGEGNDTYFVDSAGDVVTENGPNTDHDSVYTTGTYTLGDNIESLRLNDVEDANGTLNYGGYGNSLNNMITGNYGNNELHGGDGDDVIEGAPFSFFGSLEDDGNDKLFGENGDDSLLADKGDDSLTGGDGSDGLQGDLGNDSYFFSAGDDGDFIFDEGGTDKIVFDTSVNRSNISFFLNESQDYLEIGYSAPTDGDFGREQTDFISVQSFNVSDATKVERFEILNADGTVAYHLDAADINGIINDINAYETSHGSFFNAVEVAETPDLMAQIVAHWQVGA